MDLVIRATDSLLPKLVDLLTGEYQLQKGVKKQIELLQGELENAQAVLHDVAEVPLDQLKEPVRIWARELREASYDMEDILDTFLVRVKGDAPDPEPANSSRWLERALEKIVGLFTKIKARHSIAGDIDEIMDHLQQVARRYRDYAVGDIKKPNAVASVIYPGLHAKYQDMTQQIVGIDKSRDELISKLKSPRGGDVSNKKLKVAGGDVSNNKLKVVSVVGVGGLGKTTLARASYEKLKVDFGSCALVSVGRDPVFKDVFKRILIDLDRQHYTSKDFDFSQMDYDILIDEIRGFLRNKRYLIVIDDIWEKGSWKIIKYAFDSEGECGSRVITTTRNLDVAREADEIYKLQPLQGDFPKKLFYAIVEQSPSNRLDDAPDKFLKKCDGVPLAIITMASMLKNKRRGDWLQVYDSIGFDHEDCKEEVDIMKILSTSYYDLHSRLQTCLLYLSVFPEDSIIDKKSLIRKWVAEGFIDQKPGLSLFEVGERYFEELIDRSMIRGVGCKVRYKFVVGCQVHDMVLDLIRSKACEENFVSVFSYGKGTCLQPEATVRRLVEQNRMEQFNHIDMSHVRSFIASMSHFDKLAPLSSFKLLRVLDINDCESVCHLEHIAHLLHLRYLGLRRLDNIRELPKEIGDLKLLQTLELVGYMTIDELPSTLAHVKGLVCLRLISLCFLEYMEPGTIRALTSLEELQLEDLDCDRSRLFVKELGSLKSLRVLEAGINTDDKRTMMDFIEALRNLQELRSLSVRPADSIFERVLNSAPDYTWEAAGLVLSRHLQYMDVHDEIIFSRLPSYIDGSHLPCLSSLQLRVRAMDDKDLERLGKLPELRCLKLEIGSTVTLNIQNGDACFQKLRFLSMPTSMLQFLPTSFHMWNGRGDAPFIGYSERKDYGCRVAPAVIMPNLEELVFAAYGPRYCNNLGLENLPLLQKIEAYEEEITEETEVALSHAYKAHPNNPSVHIINRKWRRLARRSSIIM